MRVAIACVVCLIVGMYLGAHFVSVGADEAAAGVVECIQQPDSCGMEGDDIDPQEKLVPA